MIMRHVLRLFFGLLSTACAASAAELVVADSATGKTPDVLAFNLGNFYPGSNTADWWRYTEASGARIFLSPAHFKVGGTVRPGEEQVTDEASFLARRAALRDDPLNTDYINWPVIEARFNTELSGNNRIVPDYALREIHRLGGKIKAQMTLSEGGFPIADEDDWAGKWVAWRTFYSVAFYLAREFDVERFASHNEPNHPNSHISPSQWLMRLRLSSDAVQSALEDVNALYEKSLQPRFKSPVTAGSLGASFNDYGKPAVESIRTNFLGQTPPGYQAFHHYAYQRYTLSPGDFASDFLALRENVNAVTPSGLEPLPFAITEYNVHTGATYDGMPQSSDTLFKAVRFGAITSRLAAAGIEEFYAFKFGMTVYPSTRNFPVQKNGMAFADNDNAPYHHGTLGRSAEVYRLFNKGFAPGRELLTHTLGGEGADNLAVLVSRDPATGFIHIFSANESGSAVPFEIDLSALNLPEGNHAVIEDVSQRRTGIVRSVERIDQGRLTPGNQPGQTVWLIQIQPDPERHDGADDGPLALPVAADLMVRDGDHANTSFANAPFAYARHDSGSADGRAATFLRFDLPADWDPDDLLIALLAVPVRTANGGSGTIHAHLYGMDDHAWDAESLTWNTAPNLRQNAPLGDEIRHRVIEGAGESAHILAQITGGGSWTTRQIDVTKYLRRQGEHASFLLTQDPRWDIDINVDSVPASWDDLERGDTQPDGLRIRTTREAASPEEGAHLILIRRGDARQSFHQWIESFHLEKGLVEDAFDYPAAPLAGLGAWVRGVGNPTPDDPSDDIVVSDGAVLFDWTTDQPVNNIVTRIWSMDDLVQSGPLFASFDFRVLEAPQVESNVRPGFLSFANSAGNQQRGYVGIRAGSSVGTYQLGVSPSSQLGGNFTFAPVDLQIGQTYQVTLRFDAGSQNATLWVVHEEDTIADLHVLGSGTNTGIRRLNLRLWNSNGSGGTTRLGRFVLDHLLVTTPDTENTTPTANPSHDGFPNLMKFALGLDPRVPAGNNAPRIVRENGGLALSFTRNPIADGVELTVEKSHDLAEWSPYSANLEVISEGPPQLIRVPVPVDHPEKKLFLRLFAKSTP